MREKKGHKRNIPISTSNLLFISHYSITSMHFPTPDTRCQCRIDRDSKCNSNQPYPKHEPEGECRLPGGNDPSLLSCLSPTSRGACVSCHEYFYVSVYMEVCVFLCLCICVWAFMFVCVRLCVCMTLYVCLSHTCVCAHLQSGEDYFVHRREVGLPQNLCPLPQSQHSLIPNCSHCGRNLDR